MYNINKEIENEIIDAINPLIDEYLQGRTAGTSHAKNVISRKDYDQYFDGHPKTIFDAKRDFKKNKNISQLLKDIKFVGYRTFTKMSGLDDSKLSEQRYRDIVVKLLNEIIRDRIAIEKDKKVMENMENVEKFDKYFESNNTNMKVYRADVTGFDQTYLIIAAHNYDEALKIAIDEDMGSVDSEYVYELTDLQTTLKVSGVIVQF